MVVDGLTLRLLLNNVLKLVHMSLFLIELCQELVRDELWMRLQLGSTLIQLMECLVVVIN